MKKPLTHTGERFCFTHFADTLRISGPTIGCNPLGWDGWDLAYSGGKLAQIADITVHVPETETYRVQELHLPVYHYLCAATEAHFFAE